MEDATPEKVAPGEEPRKLDRESAKELAEHLVAQAKTEGVDLVGPDGLLTGITKQVLETALGHGAGCTPDGLVVRR